MTALRDLTGQTFDRLTVLERDPGKKPVHWICKCSCGNTASIRTDRLVNGFTRSCGCINKERADDLAGQRFGRLIAESRAPNHGTGVNAKSRWTCRCDCGGTVVAFAYALKSGNTKSCGCLKQETGVQNGKLRRRHGMTKSKEWITWDSMLQRCRNPRHKSYMEYGGRGIHVCDRWSVFENFYADMGPAAPGMTIERIDVNRGYEPGNCTWIPAAQQALNKRTSRLITANGKTQTIAEWSRETGIAKSSIHSRVKHGWDAALAVTLPPTRLQNIEL